MEHEVQVGDDEQFCWPKKYYNNDMLDNTFYNIADTSNPKVHTDMKLQNHITYLHFK